MQKIKDKSKKIKVSHLQTIFNIFFVKLIFMLVFHNILNLLSFLKFMNGEALNEAN
jgi:hypothetical protein